ncbi:MAG: septum formation protein Maf [Verrucomicrobia bacterium]|nr:septum formation protein Maf [Verrucomicrobiota bacterium]
MRLILASASPRRAELLGSLGLRFEIIPSDAVEHDAHPVSPGELALHNAQLKARDVAARHQDAWVIGADTIVVLGETVFGKPRDPGEARRMLRRLSGHNHRVITGVCLISRGGADERSFAVETTVRFRALGDADIEGYLAAVNVLDKAGAYAIQEGPPVVAGIEGSYSNVVGLPLERLAEELRGLGVLNSL